MINTVRGNLKGYIRRGIKDTHKADKRAELTGNTSKKGLKTLVSTNAVSNFDINPESLSNSLIIYGPPRANVRGKTSRTKPDHVDTDTIQIPREFQRQYHYVTLVDHVFFVNEIRS